MVTLDKVSRTYEDGFSISVSLSVPKGSLVSLLGPSGSGKTTTLRFIAGFEEPDAGHIHIEGHEVTHVPPADRRVGFVFQDYTLFPHMNVFDNVAYGLRVRHTPTDEIADRVEHFLSVVGLPGYGGRDVHTLSGGERQRVALARALVIEPDVLLLDEPFSSIDAILRRDLRREVMRLQRTLNVTTIFVTHSRDEAMSIADHLVLIRDGAVMQQGPPDEVFTAPVNRFAASFVGGANFIEGTLEEDTLHAFQDFAVRRTAGGPGTAGAPADGRGPAAGRGPADGAAVSPASAPNSQADVDEDTREANVGPGRRTILLRPHQLRFADAGAVNAFPVVIAERQYFAHYFEYTCRWAAEKAGDGADEAVGSYADARSDGAAGGGTANARGEDEPGDGELEFIVYDRERRETGTRAHLAFDPADAVILPE